MSDNIRRTIESYDQTAVDYAQTTAKIVPSGRERFLSCLGQDSRILDLGCGSGRDAGVFVGRGHRVVGVDLSAKLLEIARRDVPGADFRLMDITRLEFEPGSFDGIYAVASLVHVPKSCIVSALQSCHRVLSDSGVMYVSVKLGDGEKLMPDERYGDVMKFWSFFRQGEMDGLLRTCGFWIMEDLSATIRKDDSYATNPWIDIFCKK